MATQLNIEREEYFAQYFNLKRRHKELQEKKVIQLPKTKKYFKKTREFLQDESDDIEAIANYIGNYGFNKKQLNLGVLQRHNNFSLDGAGEEIEAEKVPEKVPGEVPGEAKVESSAENTKNKGEEEIKNQAKEAINKKIIARAVLRTTLNSFGAIITYIGAIFALALIMFFLIIMIMLWLFGAI